MGQTEDGGTQEQLYTRLRFCTDSEQFHLQEKNAQILLKRHFPSQLNLLNFRVKANHDFCSEIYRFQLLYEHFDSTLQQDISKGRSFNVIQVLELLKSILLYLKFLGQPHRFLNTQSIVRDHRRQVKVFDPLLARRINCLPAESDIKSLSHILESMNIINDQLLKLEWGSFIARLPGYSFYAAINEVERLLRLVCDKKKSKEYSSVSSFEESVCGKGQEWSRGMVQMMPYTTVVVSRISQCLVEEHIYNV